MHPTHNTDISKLRSAISTLHWIFDRPLNPAESSAISDEENTVSNTNPNVISFAPAERTVATNYSRPDHLMPKAGGPRIEHTAPTRRVIPDRAPIDKALALATEAHNAADQQRQAAQRRLKAIAAAEKAVADSAEALRQARIDAFESNGSPEQQMALGEVETRHRDIEAASAPAIAAKPDVLARLEACEAAVAEAEARVDQARAAVDEADRWDVRLTVADDVADAIEILEQAHARLREVDAEGARSMRRAVREGEIAFDPLAATASEVWRRPEWVRR